MGFNTNVNDLLTDAQSTYRKALRMGMLEHNSGTWEGYTK